MNRPLSRPAPAVAVRIPVDGATLVGDLVVPRRAIGLVIFAHGSGSSRLSPRNAAVAEALQRHGLATLLTDLLTTREDADYRRRFDISLLAARLDAITAWVAEDPAIARLHVGYFGASTGAAAALQAASHTNVEAVVLRGGRVDLAPPDIAAILQAPTLLIVGQHDYGTIEANENLFLHLTCKRELAVIPGATHLFQEPGALDRVARLAAEWFTTYLVPEEEAP